jgi:hypothetical protein
VSALPVAQGGRPDRAGDEQACQAFRSVADQTRQALDKRKSERVALPIAGIGTKARAVPGRNKLREQQQQGEQPGQQPGCYRTEARQRRRNEQQWPELDRGADRQGVGAGAGPAGSGQPGRARKRGQQQSVHMGRIGEHS